MIEKNSARVLIGAMNLLAVGSPMMVNQVSHAAKTDHKIEKLNVASLKSIESTWLKVPNPLFQESCRLGVFKISSGRDKKINWNHVKNTVES